MADNDKNKLTPKQAAFVAEYLISLNATEAARRAGYSVKTASEQAARLLGNVKVSAAIAQAQAERAEKTGRTALDVLMDIQAVTRAARDADDLRTALKGLELEGKHLGMFVDKLDAKVDGALTIKVLSFKDMYEQ